MRAMHIALGFAIFTALAVFFALRAAKSTPLWLVMGSILLGLLIIGKVTLTLLSLEKRHAIVAQEHRARRTKARARSQGRRAR